MDEDVTKAILEQPTELNDIPASTTEVTPGATPTRKARNKAKKFKFRIPFMDYKDEVIDALEDSRPVRAISLLTDMFGTSEPEVDTLPNTAHAIIDAARETTKQSMYNQKNLIPTPAQNGTGMKPIENTFADKDPQTYQSMLPGTGNKVSPQIAQKGQAMPNNLSKLSYIIDPNTGMPVDDTEEQLPFNKKLLMAGGTGLGAGLLHHKLTLNKADSILSPLQAEYLHMAETGNFDPRKLNLLNQELAERGLNTRLISAGSKGIAKARMDKVIGELGQALYATKLKGALPYALLGASIPFVSSEVGDLF